MATEYVVLAATHEREGEGHWRELGGNPVEASNDRAAIREATKGLNAEQRAGVFVAVPLRSWQPRTRAIETKEVDRWT